MIRYADLKDFDRIMEMMIDFANSSPYEAHHDPQYGDTWVRRLLCKFMQNGCILLGEKDDKVQGMLIAVANGDTWLPDVITLKELAWWVEPEYRNTTLGYKLLAEYIKLGKGLTETGKIQGFTLTNMVNSPDFDFESRGWDKVETNYIWNGA